MSTYLKLNLLIIIFPLLLSFLPRYRSFYAHWRQWLGAIISVGFIFIVWDIIVTSYGHWTFNPSQVLPYRLIHLPLEEWLFFITVPFSCLFLYQALKNYFPQRLNRPDSNRVIFWISIIILVLIYIFYQKTYTLVATCFTAVTSIVVFKFRPQLFRTKSYWLYSILGLGLFIIFNGWLTSVPVVIYNNQVIVNIRLGTIPIEDFFYNWSLLTLYAFVYDLIGQRYETSS